MKQIFFLSILLTAIAANAQNEARPGFVRDATPPEPRGAMPNTEGFEDVAGLLAGDWESINTSDNAAGATAPEWFQGTPTVFPAHAGAEDAYAAANFNATGGSQISMWMLAPDVGILESATFYTRTVTASTFPDRMQVRFSSVGGSNVGTDPATVGDYSDLLLDLNSNLAIGGYPEDWTEFTVTPGSEGRLAFRYLVDTDAGPIGSNSNYIGVDSFTFVLGLPEALPVPALNAKGLLILSLMLLGLGGWLVVRR